MTQKVKDIIKFLSAYPKNAELVFYTGVGGERKYWLSNYTKDGESADKAKVVCVDIGAADE